VPLGRCVALPSLLAAAAGPLAGGGAEQRQVERFAFQFRQLFLLSLGQDFIGFLFELGLQFVDLGLDLVADGAWKATFRPIQQFRSFLKARAIRRGQLFLLLSQLQGLDDLRLLERAQTLLLPVGLRYQPPRISPVMPEKPVEPCLQDAANANRELQ